MENSPRLPLCNTLLQQTLQTVCTESDWVYAVFWRVLPRNFPPPKWEFGRYLERSKANKRNWILVWEDGFCDFARFSAPSGESETSSTSSKHTSEKSGLNPLVFFQMSHEVYNYGEGLMGKVAANNGHKWIYKDPPDGRRLVSSFLQSSIDPPPRSWEAQFKHGIQTIAVICVCEGLVQLGSTQKLFEDINFVVALQTKFRSLQRTNTNVPVRQPSLPCAGTVQHVSCGSFLERRESGSGEPQFSNKRERLLSWVGNVRDSTTSDQQEDAVILQPWKTFEEPYLAVGNKNLTAHQTAFFANAGLQTGANSGSSAPSVTNSEVSLSRSSSGSRSAIPLADMRIARFDMGASFQGLTPMLRRPLQSRVLDETRRSFAVPPTSSPSVIDLSSMPDESPYSSQGFQNDKYDTIPSCALVETNVEPTQPFKGTILTIAPQPACQIHQPSFVPAIQINRHNNVLMRASGENLTGGSHEDLEARNTCTTYVGEEEFIQGRRRRQQ